jgi:hypothetical protein
MMHGLCLSRWFVTPGLPEARNHNRSLPKRPGSGLGSQLCSVKINPAFEIEPPDLQFFFSLFPL